MIKNEIEKTEDSEKINKTKHEKIKNIKQICKLYIKAHKLNMIISIILLFCFSFASYIGIYYTDSGGEKQKHNVWNYSTNLIYTFPNDCEITTDDFGTSKFCYDFDIFNLEYLNKAVENNKDIIAYALVWDSINYNHIDIEKSEKMAEEISVGKEISIKKQLVDGFNSYFNVFQIVMNEDTAGFVCPETTYVEIVKLSSKFISFGATPRAFPYEMVQPEKIPLIAGNYPKEDHEIIIGNDFAEALMKALDFESKDQLIGEKLSFNLRSGYDPDKLPDDWGDDRDLELHVIISGVTSYENILENRIYFKRNAFQSSVAKIHHYDVNKLYVQQEKFLVDPTKDTQSIMEKLNENSPLVKDSYHIFNGEDNVYIEWSGKINQDQKMMKQIIAVLLIITIIFLMLHRFFFKKQLKKESHIIKQCGYSPIKVEAIVNLCLCIITGLLSFVLMMGCIPLLNQAALSILNRSVLDWSLIHFVYSFLFVVVIYEIGTTLYFKYLTRG